MILFQIFGALIISALFQIPALCLAANSFQDDGTPSRCIHDIALDTKDADFCENSEFNLQACLYPIIRETKDVSACEKFKFDEETWNCYSYFVRIFKDKSLCMNILDEGYSSHCRAMYGNNVSP